MHLSFIKILLLLGNDDVLIQFDGYDVQCLLDRRLSTTFYQTEGLGKILNCFNNPKVQK